MTLQERQKREEKALALELSEVQREIQEDGWSESLRRQAEGILWAQQDLVRDPETYFKNIDEQE